MTGSVTELLDRFREFSRTNRERGGRFEELMAAYLGADPAFADRFEDVWLWSDWPGRGGRPDTGIDLVASERGDGGFCAIQCKFYEPDHAVSKRDVDTFLATSGKRPFTSRLIISTTDRWGTNAEEALRDQVIPVSRIGMADLLESPVRWDRVSQDGWGRPQIELGPRHEVRPHQREAIYDVRHGFAAHDRGKLIMACGTGKTFTALKLAEELAAEQRDRETRVLFCVPSISLISQTLREWTAQRELPLRAFAVCSDTKVSRSGEDISAVDLALPATTDAGRLVGQVDSSATEGSKRPGVAVVFATYQSIGVINEAQRLGFPAFDLIIADEAHRTTGVTLSGADESAFVRVHDADFIKARRRLYMTATPRLFRDDVKQAAEQRDAVLCSMDDESLYGPEFHRLGFGEAVDRGLLTDYKVLILAVDEGHLDRALQSQLADENHEIPLADAVKIVGCWNGLAKRSGRFADGSGFRPDEVPMRRAVAFSRSIADSKAITDRFTEVLDAYDDSHERTLGVQVEHVDGTFNALRRNRLLEWLKEDTPADTCRILSNARCLSEGVDVPALDAVLFLTPRNSQVDVVQSVGRVMRRAEGKEYGYVILPVGIPSDQEPDRALADNRRYQVVWQVLQALRAHDDRFNATINKIDLNKKAPPQIMVGGVGVDDEDIPGADGAAAVERTLTLFPIEQWRDAIYARIVAKCGEKTYWEQWAKDVADIAQRHVNRIKLLIEDPTSEKARAFDRFVDELRATINPGVTRDGAVDMLAQHLITKPVFDALFSGYEFSARNPVSRAMQRMLDTLGESALAAERETLEGFYASVRCRAEGIDNHEGRQRVITELYEKFFKTALPRTADAFGIVYTPIPVVDFILRATDQALRRHFGTGLTAEGVQILDPFTGTGTFIVRLLQSGLIRPEDLARKYASELNANEILLLAYCIAAINIEAAFHRARTETDPASTGYVPFGGIVLTDTFQSTESGAGSIVGLFPENDARLRRQQARDIRVIIGNPPYSSGQDSANDNNQNRSYPALDGRIAATYAARSTATNKNSLYDSYIRAIRWASDRIGEEGVIGFVSNGGYIDSNTADGLRECLADEFTDIYCYNLRGNQRTAGDLSRKEGGKIFGAGSRATVAILVLVKAPGGRPAEARSCKIHYRDIGDYLTRDEKLAILSRQDLDDVEWQDIEPNAHGDWVNQRSEAFARFTPLGAKGAGGGGSTIFEVYSAGLQTNRDAWVYNFSSGALEENVRRMIANYEQQRQEFDRYCLQHAIKDRSAAVVDFIDNDPSSISWSRSLRRFLARSDEIAFRAEHVTVGTYRPFAKEHVYFDRHLNHERTRLPQILPTPAHENFGFYLVGVGSDKPWSTLIVNQIPDLAFWGSSNGQFFPRYTWEPLAATRQRREVQTAIDDDATPVGGLGSPEVIVDGYRRVDNISDSALGKFLAINPGVTKDDVFHYCYGLLHSPEYRERFAADLKKSLPRIPMPRDADAFAAFADAGRKLAALHLGYETVDPYPLTEHCTAPTAMPDAERFRVTKMRLATSKIGRDAGKIGRGDDRSAIAYNAHLTLSGIPEDSYRYQLGSRSAIEWVMDRYQVKTDKASGIVNDPNDWSAEHDDPRYVVDLLKRVVTVSLETVKIVDALPKLPQPTR